MEGKEKEEMSKPMKIELKCYGDFENIDAEETELAESILKDQVIEIIEECHRQQNEKT